MASVAGLAPARVCLKGRVLELLCIHGHSEKRSKHQDPNPKQAPRSKLQDSIKAQHRFEHWCLGFLWSLELGIWSLAPQRSGLVGEQRTERGDDGDESGIDEIGDHRLDVFVGHRRFLVEEVALLTDDTAA